MGDLRAPAAWLTAPARPAPHRRGCRIRDRQRTGLENVCWISGQAVSSAAILRLDLKLIADLRSKDAAFNLAAGREAFRRLRDTTAEFVMRMQGSVRQRTARHLLDLAAEGGEGDPVSIGVPHAAMADSIGSRREVVTRALAELVAPGAIRLSTLSERAHTGRREARQHRRRADDASPG